MWSCIRDIDLGGEMTLFRELFSGKRLVCCALTVLYSMYNMVGRSIASIYDHSGILIYIYIYTVWPEILAGRYFGGLLKICHLAEFTLAVESVLAI